MRVIESTSNQFGGVLPKPEDLNPDPDVFVEQLRQSLAAWKESGFRVVWLEIPIAKSRLVPIAVDEAFRFHHCDKGYLMLTHCLVDNAFVPPHASHYIGAGGVVVNDRRELLVVSERYHRSDGSPPRYKLPGGALNAGEHLRDAVMREVEEETGIRTEFDALICLRHWHEYRFGKSDIYFVCRLHPISEKISIQEDEIAVSLWMPVEEYLGDENVSQFNKQIVEAAIATPGIVQTEVNGYGNGRRYEFFMPQG